MLLGKLPPVREEWVAASFFYCEIKQKKVGCLELK